MRMKKRKLLLLGVVCAALYACSTDQTNESGKRVSALDDAAWNHSEWISVANAPVITGEINGSNERAADGAAWFVSVVRNEKEITSARWMTTGLGVYELYVNGKLIGEEILKPGFTHPYKTKRSFTYEVSNALSKQAGAENVFAVQVTPGWWADKIITYSGQQGMVGTKVAFRGVLELTYADGSKAYLGSIRAIGKPGSPDRSNMPLSLMVRNMMPVSYRDTIRSISFRHRKRIRNLRERYFLQMEVRSIFVKIWRFLLKKPIYGKGSPERVKMLMERLL